MTLVVEDGTGLANANSYDSLVGIAATLQETGEDATWLALASDTLREQLALRSMRMLDTEWLYRGYPLSEDQALAWPRVEAYDDDGRTLVGVPVRVKKALALLCASGSISGAVLQPDQSAPASIALKSISVGKISISTSYQGGLSPEYYYRRVEALLAPLTDGQDLLLRG